MLTESVKLLLENNNLKLDYGYANPAMRYLKLTFYDLCRNSFGEDLVNFIFKNWRRFLDDCETLLEENEITPNDLISI